MNRKKLKKQRQTFNRFSIADRRVQRHRLPATTSSQPGRIGENIAPVPPSYYVADLDPLIEILRSKATNRLQIGSVVYEVLEATQTKVAVRRKIPVWVGGRKTDGSLLFDYDAIARMGGIFLGSQQPAI